MAADPVLGVRGEPYGGEPLVKPEAAFLEHGPDLDAVLALAGLHFQTRRVVR
jgi:hypothetical protein